MKTMERDKLVTALVIFTGLVMFAALAAAGSGHAGSEGHQPHEHASPAPGGGTSAGPLIEEMLVLDRVFREVVSAVSLGDGHRVRHALHSMHGTMEKTHEGVEHGSVRIRRNADKLATFIRMDEEFHGQLEKLEAAAAKEDGQAMLKLTKGLLDGCVRCHGMFRER